MNEMSLEEQIRCMEQIRSELGVFCQEMGRFMEEMQKDIKFLRSNGLSIETEETYQIGYYTPANAKVEEVINDIRGPHFDYIDRVIDNLKRVTYRQ